MKKITEDYLNDKLNNVMMKYEEDSNLVELYNSVVDIDEDLIPIALNLASKLDIIKFMNTIGDNENQLLDIVKEFGVQIEQNKDVIEKMDNIIKFNEPSLAKNTKTKTNKKGILKNAEVDSSKHEDKKRPAIKKPAK